MINPIFIAAIIVIIVGLLAFVTFRITRVRHQTPVRNEEKSISILPKTSLGKWSIGLIAVIILIFILVPILEYQLDIDFGPDSVIRIILAAVLGFSSIGSIVMGFIGVRRKRGVIYYLPLMLGFFTLLVSVDMMFDTGG